MRTARIPVLALLLLASCATQKPGERASAPAAPAPASISAEPATILAGIVPSATLQPSSTVVTAPFVNGLSEIVLVGRPPATRPVTEADLPALRLSKSAVLALASANVAAGLRPIAEVAPPLPPGQIGTIRGDFAEGARVLVHDEWAPLSAAMGGHLLVAIPAEDEVLYTKGGLPGALVTIADMARAEMAKSSRPVSNMVLRWTATGWEIVAKASTPAPVPRS
jgi:hypothetical protein